MRLRPLALLCLSLALAACATPAAVERPAPPAPASPSGVAANDGLNAVAWMQRAAEYRAVTETVYQAATTQLDRALADRRWDALVPGERANPVTGLPPAIIFDIDETVLDNSPHQARLVRSDTEFAESGWQAWVAEQRARAIPGAVAFAQAAARRGITLYYVSNRSAAQARETLANLRTAGFPVRDDAVFLGAGTEVPGCKPLGSSDKTCRRQLVGRTHRVLMQFGDQLGDFVQIPANTLQARAALIQEHAAWWGERWWMLPNPSYGSWEPALFDNDWKQSRELRRKAKQERLELE